MDKRQLFAKRLRELRKSKGLTQKEVGRCLNVTEAAVGMWEQARRLPDPEVLSRLAGILGVSIDYLLGNDPQPGPSTPSWWYRDTPPTDVEKVISERLRSARKRKGLTQEEVARILGVTRSVIARYESGINDPPTENVSMLAEIYNVSVDYLLGRTDDPRPINEVIRNIPGAYPVGKMVRLPVLGVIRAGEPILAVENIIGWEEVPEEDIKDGEYFFLKVKGDSMVNEHIPDGSLVLVRKQDYAENGDIVVALVNGEEATVKKYRSFNGKILLMPANPAYEPQLYDANKVRIIGVVIESRVRKKGR